jgi:ribosomal protein L7Ae-like RNA K-turn-binding protein
LIYKLKELYYIRKTKPKKGKFKKANAPPKKRYAIGLNEIRKNLLLEKLNLVILAIDIEKSEGDYGLDSYLLTIVNECRKQQIPLIFCMNRRNLGFTAKYRN